MKILHIDTGREWRGGQRQALFLHEGLLESGIESIIVCNADGEFAKRDVENLIPIKFKGEADINYLSELRKVIRSEMPDIVHTHDAHALTPAVMAKATRRKFKLINTRRVDFSINKNFFSRKKYTNALVDGVVAISEAIKNMLIDDGVNPKKIPVINSGVRFPDRIDFSKVLEYRKKYGLEEAYVIGKVANMADHKDHYTMLDAYSKFYGVIPESKLLLVGGGPMFDEIKEYASKLNCAENVIFTGHIDDVYEHIALFDVFCMSSKTEGLCTSIIDGLFMMKPVVAAAAGGIPELVKHNFNGMLSPVKDPDAMAENLLDMYDNEVAEKKFATNAFHTALKFSDSMMVSKYIKYYKELLR
jgi:glycosyltransferase involved in cell wall biosynthesis